MMQHLTKTLSRRRLPWQKSFHTRNQSLQIFDGVQEDNVADREWVLTVVSNKHVSMAVRHNAEERAVLVVGGGVRPHREQVEKQRRETVGEEVTSPNRLDDSDDFASSVDFIVDIRWRFAHLSGSLQLHRVIGFRVQLNFDLETM